VGAVCPLSRQKKKREQESVADALGSLASSSTSAPSFVCSTPVYK